MWNLEKLKKGAAVIDMLMLCICEYMCGLLVVVNAWRQERS